MWSTHIGPAGNLGCDVDERTPFDRNLAQIAFLLRVLVTKLAVIHEGTPLEITQRGNRCGAT